MGSDGKRARQREEEQERGRESEQQKSGEQERERRQQAGEVMRDEWLSDLKPSHYPTALQMNLLRGGKKNKLFPFSLFHSSLFLPPSLALCCMQDRKWYLGQSTYAEMSLQSRVKLKLYWSCLQLYCNMLYSQEHTEHTYMVRSLGRSTGFTIQ